MIDFARITVIAGKGGDGSGSFLNIKRKRLGKADGGDGGRGGDIYMVATRDLNTLEPFRFIKEYKAKIGGNGLSRKRTGAEGKDLIIKVPQGTLVKVTSGKKKGDSFDIVHDGQKELLASGGAGGRGNTHLRDKYGRRPFSGGKGDAGELNTLELELKLIADVGLIGLPNAGKSTLLRVLTAADPKVAAYPFTTLEPNLGVLTESATRVVIADIPGLIEGASRGKGLGDLFLRHIERTRVLVHLIDVSQENLWGVYQSLRGELKSYSVSLVKKKEIIVLNKVDLVDKKKIAEGLMIFKHRRKKVVAVSAKSGAGLDDLIRQIYT